MEIVNGVHTAEQKALSDILASRFIPYLNSLGLKSPEGKKLTLDSEGKGTFRDYVESFIIQSAQTALEKRQDIDFDTYLDFITRMKPVPAFDSYGLDTPENGLFGSETEMARHFADFMTDGNISDDLTWRIRLMNPMNYIGSDEADSSLFWRIRHGASDRDTSFAIPVILKTALENAVKEVDFALPWGIPHSGDYDLGELFAWIDRICR